MMFGLRLVTHHHHLFFHFLPVKITTHSQPAIRNCTEKKMKSNNYQQQPRWEQRKKWVSRVETPKDLNMFCCENKIYWTLLSKTLSFAPQQQQQRQSAAARNKNNHQKPCPTKSDATHYMLNGHNGGVLVVPDDLYAEFLAYYAQDLINGVPHYIAELRTPLFRWYADLDFYGHRPVTRSEVVAFVKIFQNTIREFYPIKSSSSSSSPDDAPLKPSVFDVVVLTSAVLEKAFDPSDGEADEKANADDTETTTPSTPPSPDIKKRIKTGIHLVMPNLPVNQAECLHMREALLVTLEENTDPQLTRFMKDEWNSWQDIFDETVYRSNGLRMPGSDKAARCDVCQRDPVLKKSCASCGMKGYLAGGRVYTPDIFVNHDGTLCDKKIKRLQRETDKMVKFLTIRLPYPPKKPEWVAPFTAPLSSINDDSSATTLWGCEKERKRLTFLEDISNSSSSSSAINGSGKGGAAAATTRKRKRTQDQSQGQTSQGQTSHGQYPEDNKTLCRWKDKVLVESAEILTPMEAFLRSAVNPDIYGRIQIREMFHLATKDFFIITTRGFGSHNCMNMVNNQKHNNNTIYFMVTPSGVSQRCFCRCVGADKLKTRKGMFCKDYKGPMHALNEKLICLLFPDSLAGGNNTNGANNVMHYQDDPVGYLRTVCDSVNANFAALHNGSSNPSSSSSPAVVRRNHYSVRNRR